MSTTDHQQLPLPIKQDQEKVPPTSKWSSLSEVEKTDLSWYSSSMQNTFVKYPDTHDFNFSPKMSQIPTPMQPHIPDPHVYSMMEMPPMHTPFFYPTSSSMMDPSAFQKQSVSSNSNHHGLPFMGYRGPMPMVKQDYGSFHPNSPPMTPFLTENVSEMMVVYFLILYFVFIPLFSIQ